MIKSITIVTHQEKRDYFFSNNGSNKVVIDCLDIAKKNSSFSIEIIFLQPIKYFRNHDYSWVDCKENRIANEFSPKIIQLENGYFIQANCTVGFWEIDKKEPNMLFWKFNPENSKPLTVYADSNNIKKIEQANSVIQFPEIPALLITTKAPIEFSRSQIPFAAVTCFTDHCDFDTLENLKIQRNFFNANGIKVTKGFFLNHFSKRDDNASFENNTEELLKWQKDGHELCYHSLSQSIKSDAESFSDFENFVPPMDIPVWIDHGFQSYNFSLYKKFGKSNSYFESILRQKKITTLWNYIDSGTAVTRVINQLNVNQFNLNQFAKAIRSFSFKKRMVLLFKNVLFHYDNDAKRIRNYIDLLGNSKAFLKNKKPSSILKILKNGFSILPIVVKVLFLWNTQKNKTFKIAKYAPILFKHQIDKQEFLVFQTIEMVDFKMALCKKNIDSLVNESGLFIAHTYFSVNMKHHQGRLFATETSLDEEVVQNFEYLSEQVKKQLIWNPTLTELTNYLVRFEKTIVDVDANGTIFIKNDAGILFRTIS